MNGRMHYSHRTWFTTYYRTKHAVVLVIVAYAVGTLLMAEWSHRFMWIVLGSLLLTILLFEWLNQPSFLAVDWQGDTGSIQYFVPDRRYFFRLDPAQFREITWSHGDRLEYRIQRRWGTYFLRLHLIRRNRTQLTTEEIGIGWSHIPALESLLASVAFKA